MWRATAYVSGRRGLVLLETTDQPIAGIAAACGFGTPASLRAHFARIVGTSPATYRHTFSTDTTGTTDPAALAALAAV